MNTKLSLESGVAAERKNVHRQEPSSVIPDSRAIENVVALSSCYFNILPNY